MGNNQNSNINQGPNTNGSINQFVNQAIPLN